MRRSWTNIFVRNGRPYWLSSIQPQEQFRDMIMRMRAGADRNQHVFSLLLFYVSDLEANRVAVQYLAHTVANRIRIPDEVGWFDNKRIGVLLPYTSTDGAQKLADDICQTTVMGIYPNFISQICRQNGKRQCPEISQQQSMLTEEVTY